MNGAGISTIFRTRDEYDIRPGYSRTFQSKRLLYENIIILKIRLSFVMPSYRHFFIKV